MKKKIHKHEYTNGGYIRQFDGWDQKKHLNSQFGRVVSICTKCGIVKGKTDE